MNPRRLFQAIFWVFLYLALTLAPLLILLVEPRSASREFFREFSVGLGFAGLAMAGLQFVITARFRFLSAPYGTDILYYFHRQISILAAILVAVHPLLLFIFDPPTLKLLNFLAVDTPWRARAGLTALLAMVLLVILSVWRKRLKLDYYRWRLWHGLFATLLVGLAMAHIILVGYHFNATWKQIFWVTYTLFWVGLLGYTRLLRPWWILRNPWVVEQVITERGNTWTLVLKPLCGKGMHFKPGQFAWISVADSPYAHRDHPFTIASSAEYSSELRFSIRSLGDFTATIRAVKPGTKVYVEGPYGSFSVDHHPRAERIVLIAGGVGITPMMSMLRTLADRGDRRPVTLIYANRDCESIIFREEIESLLPRLNLRLVHVLEKPPQDWEGERGFVSAELLRRELPEVFQPDVCEVFICGPAPMMDAVESSLARLGFPSGDYHSERFDMV